MKIAFLTAGGIAPCLSASIGALIDSYNQLAPDAELMGYLNGYRGLLLGNNYDFPSSYMAHIIIVLRYLHKNHVQYSVWY